MPIAVGEVLLQGGHTTGPSESKVGLFSEVVW